MQVVTNGSHTKNNGSISRSSLSASPSINFNTHTVHCVHTRAPAIPMNKKIEKKISFTLLPHKHTHTREHRLSPFRSVDSTYSPPHSATNLQNRPEIYSKAKAEIPINCCVCRPLTYCVRFGRTQRMRQLVCASNIRLVRLRILEMH